MTSTGARRLTAAEYAAAITRNAPPPTREQIEVVRDAFAPGIRARRAARAKKAGRPATPAQEAVRVPTGRFSPANSEAGPSTGPAAARIPKDTTTDDDTAALRHSTSTQRARTR